MVALVATMSYPYAERSLVKGDAFDASEKDADLLKQLGRAVDAPTGRRYATKVMQPDPDASQEAASPVERPKRRYQRRDLVPEP